MGATTWGTTLALITAKRGALVRLLARTPADARDMVKDYFLKLNQDAGTVKPALAPAPKSAPATAPKAMADETIKE